MIRRGPLLATPILLMLIALVLAGLLLACFVEWLWPEFEHYLE